MEAEMGGSAAERAEVAAKETTNDSMDTAVDVASMATRQWIAE